MDPITQALGDDYVMFYHPAIDTKDLIPVENLEQCIDLVNRQLDSQGPQISLWQEGWRNKAAKLVRVNWIYQRLGAEPIRKPILAHPETQGLVVDCGDTRLMSLSLLEGPARVAVVITCAKSRAHEFEHWRPINDSSQLKIASGFGSQAHVYLSTNNEQKDRAIDWLEIGDASTSHHLHDQNLRERMIETYLQKQSNDFRFSRDWARQSIDWQDLLANAQNL